MKSRAPIRQAERGLRHDFLVKDLIDFVADIHRTLAVAARNLFIQSRDREGAVSTKA